MPEFSIIIPIYNVEKYLPAALESVLAQGFQDWEAILVDDGATDGSFAVASEYCARDSRLSIIRQKNGGLSAARNAGIPGANGKYIFFFDSDDLLCPDVLQIIHDTAERFHDPDIICGRGFSRFLDTGPKVETSCRQPELPGDIMTGTAAFNWLVAHRRYAPVAPVWTRCYHRSLFQSGDLLFVPGRLHEDEEWTPRAFYKAQRVAFADTCTIRYRSRSNSIMHSNQDAKIKNTIANIIDMLDFLNSCSFNNKSDSSPFMDDIVFQYASFILRDSYTLKDKFSALNQRKTNGIAKKLKSSPYFMEKSSLGSNLYSLVRALELLPFTLPLLHLAVVLLYNRKKAV